MSTLCPAHKIELAIQDVFKSLLNNDCDEDYINIYYLCKKTDLRWRLFKRQSLFQAKKYIRYKRPDDTKWGEHQIASLKSHLHNLLIFIRFCNNQIVHPDNVSIKKIHSKLERFPDNICETKRLIFEAIKHFDTCK